MLIKVVSVNREDVPNKNGKGTYGKLTVAYRNDQGKLAEKPLLSFTNPAVFKAFEKAEAGDEINVKSEKVGDYWNWTALLAEGEVSQTTTTSSSPTTKVTGSNYETKEERALKQRYIVKQSSISAAVAILTTGAKSAPSVKDVIALADEFVEYVFSDDTKSLTDDFSVDGDDVPY
jgi:hypothetical protein